MFFDRLKQLCDVKGISIYKAATSIGLNRSAATKWKTGTIPNGDTLTQLAELFGVSVGYLLGEEAENAPTVGSRSDILDEVDIAFYGDYRELSEDDKATLRDMARIMRERRSKKQE